MPANPEMLQRVEIPPEQTEKHSIHTSTSSWATQPNVLQTQPSDSNMSAAIAPDKRKSTIAEGSTPTAVPNGEHVNNAENGKLKHDISPPQPSVNVDGMITDPTAGHRIERAPSNGRRETVKNSGIVRRTTVKAIQEEGKAASELMKAKMRELECLKEIGRRLEKDESSALSNHRAAMQAEHKTGLALLAAKTRHESALIDLNSKETRLNTCRERALEQHTLLSQKQEEVEELKRRNREEDRERRSRMKAQKKGYGFSSKGRVFP